MITYIHRSKLEPHPDNPRKDLGDLTELAASIKRSGLLQNLTVVPSPEDPDKYRIIIGHRRFAASELAGLEELPCVIEEMSPADQVATMLAENMQRSDLTIADQVSGMQMMMDLGESVNAISTKTGLSKTSVRKRITLTALPQKEMRIAVDKGATLLNLMEIMELEDEAERENVLSAFGTNNWNYALTVAKSKQDKKKFREKMLPMLEGIEPMKTDSDCWSGKYKEVCTWRDTDKSEPTMPDLEPGKKYCYKDNGWNITLYVLNEEFEKRNQESKAESNRRKLLVKEGQELSRQTFELRCIFVQNFRANEAKRNVLWENITQLIVGDSNSHNPTALRSYHSWESNDMRKMLAMPIEDERNKDESFADEMIRRGVNMDRLILAWALCGGVLESRTTDGFIDNYTGNRKDDPVIKQHYALLEALGYQPSDFEKSMLDGTHPFFNQTEVNS